MTLTKNTLNPNSIKNHELKNVLRLEAQKKSVKRNGKYRWKHAQAHLKNRLKVEWKGVMSEVVQIFVFEAGRTAPL